MSDKSYRPRTSYYPMDWTEWDALHDALAELPAGSVVAELIGRSLDDIQRRSDERFAMVVWSFADLCVAVAKADGRDEWEYGDEADLDDVGLTWEAAQDLAESANGLVADTMTSVGWDALDLIVRHRR